MTPELNRYTFTWDDLSIKAQVSRLADDGKAELSVFHQNGSGETLLHYTAVNLLSTTMAASLAKRLNAAMKLPDWDVMLTTIAAMTMKEYRKGEPAVPIGTKPNRMTLDWQLQPLIVKGEPTTIYAPGGSGKSLIADFIGLLVQLGICWPEAGWIPMKGNVLYLDWEADEDVHKKYAWAIKQGMNMDSDETFLYRFCSQPLTSDRENIQQMIVDNDIDLVIIDSQMAASGAGHPGSDAGQTASHYYNALRSFRCSSLTIDHVTKFDMQHDLETNAPIGSVVKFNRSRSQFELKAEHIEDKDSLKLSLVHHKFNLGRLRKALGIEVQYINTDEDTLEKIIFKTCNLADSEKLAKTLSNKDRIADALKKVKTPATVQELSEALNIDAGVVRTTCNRWVNKLFVRLPDEKWGLLQKEEA